MKGIWLAVMLLIGVQVASAQETRFRRDTTGGFKGVYCIGPLDLEDGPMIVLDDKTITRAEFKTLDQKDIECVKVYKDTLATALYGSSAVRGAIIITSKNKKKAKR